MLKHIKLTLALLILGSSAFGQEERAAMPGDVCLYNLNTPAKKSAYYDACMKDYIACAGGANESAEKSSCSAMNSKWMPIFNSPDPGTSGSTASSSSTTGQKISETNKLAYKSCSDSALAAAKYCANPLSDATGGAIGGRVTNSLMQIGLGATAIYGQTQGAKDYCDLMAKAGGSTAALNGLFAAKCEGMISECEDLCDSNTKVIDNPQVVSDKNLFGTQKGICQRAGNSAAQMEQAAVQALSGAGQAALCANALDNTPPIAPPRDLPPDMTIPTYNCQTNPNDPACRQFGGGGGGATTVGVTPAAKHEFTGNIADLPDDIEQPDTIPGGEATQASNAGIANGGGGGLPGAGGNGAFGGPDDKKGGQGRGYDTNIDRGERGGGGASAASGGGGWGGYGSNGSEPSEKQKREFDLSKYMPGQAGGARGPAGLEASRRELGAIHEDIFKKMSDRITNTCNASVAIKLRDCHR